MPTEPTDAEGKQVALLSGEVFNVTESLPAKLCLQIHRLMVRDRTIEERMIKMSKSGQGYFWIGGPGEEAFNTCLGLQVKKGRGPAYDYLHLHYRNSATLLAMGLSPIEPLRQMAMTLTDTHSLGRNFAGHYCVPEWNVMPVSSVIEIQYTMAPGTAWVQRRHGGDGVSIVVGGDAGSAEGDFASCMIWSSRPGNELPVLMIVTNNRYGISTPACSQHGEMNVSDRGKPFGIVTEVVDGNDVIASWHAIARAMDYVRRERRPYILEAHVSRIYGHSSSSGAMRVKGESDPIALFEAKLLDARIIDRNGLVRVHEEAEAEIEAALTQVMNEPRPGPEDVGRFTYAPSPVDAVYPGDYTGLPR
jgi:2-oxoisovalerate dehydrogenase E1 component alpha subunit